MLLNLIIGRPISKMSGEDAKTALQKEIVKCWDDGEVASYDRLMILAKKGGVNTQTDVRVYFSLLCVEGMDCPYGCDGKSPW